MTKQLIFYIEPTRLLLFGDDMPDVKEVAFPQDIIADLEVINKEKLEALITATIQTYQVSPLPVTIICSTGLTFDKDITDIPIDKRKEELKQFLDIVPFQDITSKVFSVGKKAYAVAANNALIESFQAILKKQQFPLTAVVPYSIALLIF